MAIVSFQLDPNAQSYTDDEIVGKINSASAAITREGALSQDDLNIVKSSPEAGEFYVKNIQRDSSGKLDVDYEDVSA